ncbi:enoyl-CoA hydratase/isomerase family protein [Nocardioides sp. GY 10127]|uniref:enoyl-CoA hydratase/isomerase family protein n=1 Tax=Nocardioides sp. GY 10127 TaxID=2569762 RepID=UPI0010A8FADB|nr:enoyl-CoA hydratase/isomerase family protein [Nocardioides sp. GY 10127]TIC79405.1 enoyl-CoA hydratase/isomerase family protein [Nocardioides sp. GY 10127]
MTSDELVHYELRDRCARITLTAPQQGNALHEGSGGALLEAVRRAGAEQARVILLASEGRFFSVGGDLSAFSRAEDVAGYIDDLAETLHRIVSELVRSPAVVVSAVQGPAAGAGFPLAAAADVVLAAESATFSLGYGRVGLSPDGGSTFLTQTLGLHTVLRLALLGDRLTAAEAQAAGLVARVVPDADLPAAADAVVASLLAGSPAALAAAKRLVRGGVGVEPEALMRRETLSIRELAAGPDGVEGVRAFLAKERPRFER